MLALNEYADCTAEEFETAMGGGGGASEGSDDDDGVLGKAVANAEAQMEASSALQDAADALAEEEEVSFDLVAYIYLACYIFVPNVSLLMALIGKIFIDVGRQTWIGISGRA